MARATFSVRAVTLALGTVLLILLMQVRAAWAQAVQDYRMYVDFDSVSGNLVVDDNPLPVITGLNKNGTLHLTFQAVSNDLFTYVGGFTGPDFSTIQVGFTANVSGGGIEELSFRE